MLGRGAHTFLTHRQPKSVLGGGQGKSEPLGVVAHSLEDGGQCQQGIPTTVEAGAPHQERSAGPPHPAPSPAAHRLIQQPQQVLLIGVQEGDPGAAGPPHQVGAQSQAEQRQQPRPEGGQQRGALRGEEAL